MQEYNRRDRQLDSAGNHRPVLLGAKAREVFCLIPQSLHSRSTPRLTPQKVVFAKNQIAKSHLRDRFVEKHVSAMRRWKLLSEPRRLMDYRARNASTPPPDAHEAAPCLWRQRTNAPDRARRPITRTRRETTQTATPTQRPDPSKHKHRQATFGPLLLKNRQSTFGQSLEKTDKQLLDNPPEKPSP